MSNFECAGLIFRFLDAFLQSFKRLKRRLCFSMLGVITPATRLHLKLVYAPKRQLFLKQWSAYITGAVKFAGPIVIDNTYEDPRVAVEKVLVVFRVVLGLFRGIFRNPSKPWIRYNPKRA